MKITEKMRDGRYLAKQAKKSGLTVRNGKGDHVIVEAPVGRGYQTIPYREMGTGLASQIVKWLKAAGVMFTVYILISLFC